jgi:hypothetical protein
MVMGKNWNTLRSYFHGADIIIGVILGAGFIFWLYHHLKPEKETILMK